MRRGGYHKIGRSIAPSQRLDRLHLPPVILAAAPATELLHFFPCHDAHAVETMLHRRFASCRVVDEWFLLGDAEVEALRCVSECSDAAALDRDLAARLDPLLVSLRIPTPVPPPPLRRSTRRADRKVVTVYLTSEQEAVLQRVQGALRRLHPTAGITVTEVFMAGVRLLERQQQGGNQ
jgi:hypothetical protein